MNNQMIIIKTLDTNIWHVDAEHLTAKYVSTQCYGRVTSLAQPTASRLDNDHENYVRQKRSEHVVQCY